MSLSTSKSSKLIIQSEFARMSGDIDTAIKLAEEAVDYEQSATTYSHLGKTYNFKSAVILKNTCSHSQNFNKYLHWAIDRSLRAIKMDPFYSPPYLTLTTAMYIKGQDDIAYASGTIYSALGGQNDDIIENTFNDLNVSKIEEQNMMFEAVFSKDRDQIRAFLSNIMLRQFEEAYEKIKTHDNLTFNS